jgi:hypothetical protein
MQLVKVPFRPSASRSQRDMHTTLAPAVGDRTVRADIASTGSTSDGSHMFRPASGPTSRTFSIAKSDVIDEMAYIKLSFDVALVPG